MGTLAVGADTGEVLFWDVASRSLLGPPRTGLAGQVNSVVFSPHGDLLAVGDGGNAFQYCYSPGQCRARTVFVLGPESRDGQRGPVPRGAWQPDPGAMGRVRAR